MYIYDAETGRWYTWDGAYHWAPEGFDGAAANRQEEIRIAMATERETMIRVVREQTTTFVQAYRKIGETLYDLNLLDMLPNGIAPITSDEAGGEGLTVDQFYAGLAALQVMASIQMTTDQNRALARLMVRS